MNDESIHKIYTRENVVRVARAVTQLPDSRKKAVADFSHKSAICVSNFRGKYSTA